MSTPSLWKLSILIPIFKDGDKQDISNYRLIALLACLSKVLETLIFGKTIRSHWTQYLQRTTWIHQM